MPRFLRPAAQSFSLGAMLALAGCGDGPADLAFIVTGSVTEAFVAYRVTADGPLTQERVTLPFRVSVAPGSDGAFAFFAVDIAGAGTVGCRVEQGDEVLAEADGGVIAGCTGRLREAGGANTRLYEDAWPDGFVVPASAAPVGAAGPLLFTAISNRNRDPYVVDPRSEGPPVRLVAGNLGTCLRWSPEGARIAFFRSGDGAGLYAMNADGSDAVLLDATITPDGCPAWSPDGTELAFAGLAAAAGGGSAAEQIYVAAADGTGVRQITQNLDADTRFRHPAWSPDGARVAYVTTTRDPDPRAGLLPYDDRIFAVNADGTAPFLLSDPDRLVQDLAWAPSGDWLLYVCHEGIGDIGSGLCRVGADGAGTERLTDDRFTGIRAAAFAADGTTALFVAERDGIHGIFGFGAERVPLLLLQTDGTGLTIDDGVAPFPLVGETFSTERLPLPLPF